MNDTPETPDVNSPPMIQTVDPKFLAGLANKIKSAQNTLANDKTLAKASAKTRATWQQYGQALNDARAVLSSHKLFGKFLKDNGLDTFASRNHRTDAMWLANLDPDFVSDVVPASINSPMLIRSWYKKTLARIVAATSGETEGAKVEAAKLSEEDAKFLADVDGSDWDAAVTAWKNSSEPVKFRDMPVGDAVAAIMRKIGTYTAPGVLADALRDAFVGHDWNPEPEKAPEPEEGQEPEKAPEPEEGQEPEEAQEPEEGQEPEEASEDAPEADPAPQPRRRRRS